MKYIINKILILSTCLSKNVKVSINSNISPKFLKNVPRNLTKKVVIKNSSISGNVFVLEGVKIVNSFISGNVRIGRYVSINGPATRISARKNNIYIGNFTSIASNVVIQEDYHKFNRITTYFIEQNLFGKTNNNETYSKGDIHIQEDVWIGSNSVILSGVTIGRGSIIGAGSIVTKNVPKYSIVAGNPARVIKSRFSDKTIKKLEDSRWWELSEIDLKKNQHEFSKSIEQEGFQFIE